MHTTFEDGSELVEEFDLKTDELLVRKRRTKTALGGDNPWEYLVGEAPRAFNSDTGTLIESGANPAWTRSQDTPRAFVWRVRNLPYPKDTYAVTVDPADQKIVIRTSNKKFYKRFEVPELVVLGLSLDESSPVVGLEKQHAHRAVPQTQRGARRGDGGEGGAPKDARRGAGGRRRGLQTTVTARDVMCDTIVDDRVFGAAELPFLAAFAVGFSSSLSRSRLASSPPPANAISMSVTSSWSMSARHPNSSPTFGRVLPKSPCTNSLMYVPACVRRVRVKNLGAPGTLRRHASDGPWSHGGRSAM